MSLGKDLASIRKSQHLTLEDIQNAIKIPVYTLKKIENDTIFTDTDESITYVRSFVRSYARFLKIEDDKIIRALDAVEAGTYSGDLLADTESESTSTPETPHKEARPEPTPREKRVKPVPPSQKPTPTPPADKPEVGSVNWADMGKKFAPTSKKTTIWMGIAVILILVGISFVAYWYWGTSSTEPAATTEETQPAEIIPPDTIEPVEPETTEVQETTNPASFELGDTLTVSLYAAYGILDPVRVTSDLNWRTNPFWMEQGEAYYFDFRDSLLVRGEYNELILLFNGHVIENPRQSYFDESRNAIVITRSVLNQPEFLAPAPEVFPLEIGPPDTTYYRISF